MANLTNKYLCVVCDKWIENPDFTWAQLDENGIFVDLHNHCAKAFHRLSKQNLLNYAKAIRRVGIIH